MNWKKTLLICFIILVVGAAATTLIFFTEPTAIREGATKETAMLVDVTTAQRGTYHPSIVSTGTVQPAKDIILSPRVSGEIIRHAKAFTPGGFVRKGQVLLQIDPADYKNTLQLRKSDLDQAKADLNIEMGRQDIARKDYQLAGETLSVDNKALVLREPQLKSVKAMVDAARASVEQAELNLQRTTIRAPFDAHILTQNVNVGSQVSPGDNLGRIVGVDTYWVIATVPLSKLRWLRFPEGSRSRGSEVIVRSRSAWPEDQYRIGHLFRFIGALEDQTRLARVLVSVEDPLGYQNKSSDLPDLIIGSFVEVSIHANEIADVIRLNRDHLRKDNTAWVMEDGKLRIRDVDIVFRDAEYCYISSGLDDDDKIVTTNLTTVVDGASLRTEGTTPASEQDTTVPGSGQNQNATQTPPSIR